MQALKHSCAARFEHAGFSSPCHLEEIEKAEEEAVSEVKDVTPEKDKS